MPVDETTGRRTMADAARAILVSDLHLGSNRSLDDFGRDNEFATLLDAPELAAPAGGDCELVLLGDTFDLWQAVTDDECGSNSRKVPIEYGAEEERGRLEQVLAKHGDVVAALRRFARRERRRIVVVPGNHDHSLVHAEVQGALTNALGRGTAVSYPFFYENGSLGLYAEHGNQYDHNNQYSSFSGFDWREEARGFYFVRLFFNRIEKRDSHIENSPEGWRAVWYWMRKAGDLKLLAYAIRCFAEYARDPRVKRHLTFEATSGEAPVGGDLVDHPESPLLLVTGESRDGFFFSTDAETELYLRDAYRQSPEVREAVREVLEAQGREGETPPTGPAPAGLEGVAVGPPRDQEWAEELFSRPPSLRYPAAPLDPAVFRTVLFGHTHREIVRPLPGGRTYVNTGSWTVWNGGGTVVIAEAGGSGPAVVRRRHFDGKRFVD